MPRKKKPKATTQIISLFPDVDVSYDPEAFDELLRSQGVTMVHFRALRCPIGMVDRFDDKHPNDDGKDHGCSNGFIYKEAGKISGFFHNNSQRPTFIDEGILDSSSAGFTVPRFYDGTKEPVLLAPFDRLFLSDCEARVVTWEAVNTSQTGTDRLQYKVLSVEHAIDSRGKEYRLGPDFKIVNGNIAWKTNKGPGFDSRNGKGVVYSIRYRYQPHWYIKELMHEIRVAQVTDQATFERKVERMPYAVQLQREYAFLSDQRSKDGKNERDTRTPDDGGNLGPR